MLRRGIEPVDDLFDSVRRLDAMVTVDGIELILGGVPSTDLGKGASRGSRYSESDRGLYACTEGSSVEKERGEVADDNVSCPAEGKSRRTTGPRRNGMSVGF